jgi:hypothetical protein
MCMTYRNFKSAKKFGSAIRKYTNSNPQITKKIVSANRKVPHLQKVRKFNKLFKSANFWIYDLRTALLCF